jgi:hypothetical protein
VTAASAITATDAPTTPPIKELLERHADETSNNSLIGGAGGASGGARPLAGYRPAPGSHSTSPPGLAIRARMNSRSDSRLR